MSENLHNLDDLFKKAIEDHDETPDDRIWANIDRNLNRKKVVFLLDKYNKLKWVVAALLIFSIGMAMYSVNRKFSDQGTRQAANYRKRNVLEKITVSGDKSETERVKLSDKLEKKASDTLPERSKDRPLAKVQNVKIAGTKDTAMNSSTMIARNGLLEKQTRVTRLDQPTGKAVAASSEKWLKRTQHELSKVMPGVILRLKESVLKGAEDTTATTAKPVDLAIISRPKAVVLPEDSMPQNNLMPGSTLGIKLKNTNVIAKSIVKVPGRSRLSATLFYSGDATSSKVLNNGNTFREEDRREIKNKEDITSSTSRGVLFSYTAVRNITLQSGVTLSSLSTTIQPKTIYARADDRGRINYRFNCSAGYSFFSFGSANAPVAGDSITTKTATNTLQYVSIPLTVGYSITKGKFRMLPVAGVAVNFLTKANIETYLVNNLAGNEKVSSNNIGGLSSNYYSGVIGLTANYHIFPTIGLTFMPVARLALSSINKNAPVKTYLNSFGMGAGVTVKL